MEFHEKLQELRKQKGLTQEQLAQQLYVSRTAISKWESGRGCPNLESLKAIAKYFGVTMDDLLSGEALLTIAEENTKQREAYLRDLVFSMLDLSAVVLLFLPLFGQKVDGAIQEVSLLSLTMISLYLKIGYYACVAGMAVVGLLTLALQNCRNTTWLRYKGKLSMLWNIVSVLLFTVSLQPYAATLVFLFLMIKVLILVKRG